MLNTNKTGKYCNIIKWKVLIHNTINYNQNIIIKYDYVTNINGNFWKNDCIQ